MLIKKFYSTAEVIKKVGISRNTLYNWFKQKKIKQVSRDKNGYRIFTDSDIEAIKQYNSKIFKPIDE